MIDLDVEDFTRQHPSLSPKLLIELARVALGTGRASPVPLEVRCDAVAFPSKVSFDAPDPRSVRTLQPNEFVEKGAIVMAGLVLHSLKERRLVHVTEIGSRVDYFVGREGSERTEVIEIGGTWEGDVGRLRSDKHARLSGSPWLNDPYRKKGWVGVTRFASPVVTVLDEGREHA